MGAIGLTGKKAKNANGEIVEAYDISIGGSQSKHKRIGKLKHKSVPSNEINDVIKNILIEEYYAEMKYSQAKKNSNPFTKFMDWLSRLNENSE